MDILKRMRRGIADIFKWCFVLAKRLLRKPSFLLILLLIPALSLALFICDEGSGGELVKVVLCRRNTEDQLSTSVCESLMKNNSIIGFTLCDDESTAVEMVSNGDVDAAWIFSEDATEQTERFAKGRSGTAVTIIERESNVFMSLSHEKLFLSLFPSLSYNVYTSTIKEAGKGQEIDEAVLDEYYDHRSEDLKIVDVSYISGESVDTDSIITSPVRGLLSVFILLGGMAASIYYAEDSKRGVFTWISPGITPFVKSACVFIPMVFLAAAALVSAFLTGFAVSPLYEILMMAVFVAASAGFCTLIRLICKRAEYISIASLIIMLATLALCPIFFNTSRMKYLSYLLPSYHYLSSVHNKRSFIVMLIYTAAVWAAVIVIEIIKMTVKNGKRKIKDKNRKDGKKAEKVLAAD